MKTKQKNTRLAYLTLDKIGRYFERPTLREFIEATIEACENNPYLKQKIKDQLKQRK